MPYFPIGYPDYDISLSIIERLCAKGADVIEVGVPFSDPLADGPTIQAASQVSLSNGTSLQTCLDAVETLRRGGVTTPFVFMSYYNPLLRFGIQRFLEECRKREVDGLIVPDLPPEEAEGYATAARAAGLATIFLLR